MHVNEMIYNRGDLASRSLAIATVAAKASGATWKRRNFVNFGFCSAEFCKGLKNRKLCMFENLADVAGRQNKSVRARVRQFYEKQCNRKLLDNWKLSDRKFSIK